MKSKHQLLLDVLLKASEKKKIINFFNKYYTINKYINI